MKNVGIVRHALNAFNSRWFYPLHLKGSKWKRTGRAIQAFFAALFLFFSFHASAEKVLDVEPIMQKTGSWCWLASAAMVLTYYGMPTVNPSGDYQCGLAGLLDATVDWHGGYNPGPCDRNCWVCGHETSGPFFRIAKAVSEYPKYASAFFRSNGRNLNHNWPRTVNYEIGRDLSWETLVSEIDEGRPIIIGISPGRYLPPGLAQHAVVIVGYEGGQEDPEVIINDPYDYSGLPDPYTVNGGSKDPKVMGRYSIPLAALVRELGWNTSIYRLEPKY